MLAKMLIVEDGKTRNSDEAPVKEGGGRGDVSGLCEQHACTT